MAFRGALRGVAIGALVLLAVACGGKSDGASSCPVGAETCACTTGGACNAGLSCESNLCVRLSGGASSSGGSRGDSGQQADGSMPAPSDGAATGSADATTDSMDGTVSPSDGSPGEGAASDGTVAFSSDGSNDSPPCGATTLTGKVFDPAGQVPLAGAIVFVPVDPAALPVITLGTHSCTSCQTTTGSYVALARSDSTGTFTLTGVPSGPSVPLVVQVGKWRRLTHVAVDATCGPNSVADGVVRLPKQRSEGDIPQMAVVTGGADDLGCFLRGIGLAPTEYGPPLSGGSLDVYQGVGGPGLTTGTAGVCDSTTSTCPLYASKPALEAYDIVLLACEGGENGGTKPSASLQFMHDWLGEGGRVFATHFQYYWFKDGPSDFQNVAMWTGVSVGTGTGNYDLDTSFAAGQTFAQWLAGPGVDAAASTTIALTGVANSVSTVSQDAQRWIYDPGTMNPKYLSFRTPIGGVSVPGDASAPPTYCGKAVFSDVHTSGAPSGALPDACGTTLTAQQKALEYLFFDLSACVGP